ncbi:HNH endonuclease [Mycolicibacterium thermoresistibile]
MTAAAPVTFTADELDRFWDKVSPSGDCWLWSAAVNSKGYGTFGLIRTKTSYLAHRVVWELHHGEIPEGFTLDHSVCGDRRCVNTDHLEVVTRRVNTWRGKGVHWKLDFPLMVRAVIAHPTPMIRMSAVAAMIGVSPRLIRRAVEQGELPQVVVNHRERYICKADLIDFIVNRAAEDAGAPVLRALITERTAA